MLQISSLHVGKKVPLKYRAALQFKMPSKLDMRTCMIDKRRGLLLPINYALHCFMLALVLRVVAS